MKLLGWVIVASGLLIGLAACTVTSDTTPTGDSGTGGTAGAATGGTAGVANGGTAGAATGGTGGSAGAGTCEPADPDAASTCDLCAAEKCCTEWLACDADTATEPDATWKDKCTDVWNCALESDAATLEDAINSCNTDNNPYVNDYYTCVYVDKCKTECQN